MSIENIESAVELSYLLHRTGFEEARVDIHMPNQQEVERYLSENRSIVETVEQGGGLLFVPLNIERQKLAKGISRVLSANPDLGESIGNVPIAENAEIAASENNGKLLLNPWSYDHNAEQNALSPDQYNNKYRPIPGWDILAVTPDGLKSDIPRRLSDANVMNYFRAIRNGVLKGAIGTYKEYMVLLMIKSLGGEIIDRRSRTWLPNTFLSDVGKVATGRFRDDVYVLSAHEPRKMRQFGVRPVVRLNPVR